MFFTKFVFLAAITYFGSFLVKKEKPANVLLDRRSVRAGGCIFENNSLINRRAHNQVFPSHKVSIQKSMTAKL